MQQKPDILLLLFASQKMTMTPWPLCQNRKERHRDSPRECQVKKSLAKGIGSQARRVVQWSWQVPQLRNAVVLCCFALDSSGLLPSEFPPGSTFSRATSVSLQAWASSTGREQLRKFCLVPRLPYPAWGCHFLKVFRAFQELGCPASVNRNLMNTSGN